MSAVKRKIGSTKVHPVGLGCMSLSSVYGPSLSSKDAVDFLRTAMDVGYDLLDTATIYGMGGNEALVGEALQGRRNGVLLASKCVLGFKDGKRLLDASPGAIKRACDASLERLKTDVIDLYYLHRPDPNVPIEDSVGAMADLVAQGKIRMIGLSEMSADEICRASAVHPIAAVQSEYSLMTRNPEIAVLDTCRELDITFIPFSPVGRGYLTDALLQPERFHEKDLRHTFPRFSEPYFTENLGLLDRLRDTARDMGCSAAQLAIAWTLAQDKSAVAIPGTQNSKHLESNFQAANIQLSAEIQSSLSDAFAPVAIKGPRYSPKSQAMVTTECFAFEQ